MARTRAEIQEEILNEIKVNEHLLIFNSTSLTAIYRLFAFIVAYAISIMEQLFDTHSSEITTKIANQKTGRPSWYRTMALRFQYGFDLITDSDNFNNEGFTAEQIEASKIIKYAAVNPAEENSTMVIKIAGETNGVLAPITSEQKTAVEAYFEEVKYGGTYITVINYRPDLLYLTLKIYRDPLVLDANGISIVDGNNPVEEAIQQFMKELPFNGELILAHLVDKLQEVPGVLIPHLVAAHSSWLNTDVDDYGTATLINVKRIPESGYFELPNFDNITYVV